MELMVDKGETQVYNGNEQINSELLKVFELHMERCKRSSHTIKIK